MKYLLLTILLGNNFLFGCGESKKIEKKAAMESKNPQQGPLTDIACQTAKYNENQDSHNFLSFELTFLLDSFNYLGTPNPNDVTFCYKLGKLNVSAYTLGKASELLAKNWGLSSEQYSSIAVPAKLLQVADSQSALGTCKTDGIAFLQKAALELKNALKAVPL